MHCLPYTRFIAHIDTGFQNRGGQIPYPDEWGAYLEQQNTIAISPLAMELQTVLGLVEFTTDDILDAEVPTDLEVFPYKEEKLPIPADA